MARRSTELLDVFRTRQGAGDPAGQAGRPAKERGRPRRSGGPFEGVFLGPRQVLLVGCVVLLLLVLAFVLGLGVGRRGSGGDAAALQRTADRTTEAWFIQGVMARRDVLRREPVDPGRIAGDLGLDPRHVRVEEDREDGQEVYRVFVGPFRTEEEARQFRRSYNLGFVRVRDSYPFSDLRVKFVRRGAP